MAKRKSRSSKSSKTKRARSAIVVNDTTPKEMERDDKSCTICFELIEEKQFLPCTHFFHPKCIETWLNYSNNCPLCRHPIRDLPPEDLDEIADVFIYNMTNLTFPEFFAIYVEMAEI